MGVHVTLVGYMGIYDGDIWGYTGIYGDICNPRREREREGNMGVHVTLVGYMGIYDGDIWGYTGIYGDTCNPHALDTCSCRRSAGALSS
jgi:hypothetical protein